MADKWITTKNGNHVLIKDGETFDEVINKHEDKEQTIISTKFSKGYILFDKFVLLWHTDNVSKQRYLYL